ncbi:MAG TPA: histidine phosphatase family protein [Acidocella sp.]|nr:histidine phosphatase family protein [Acidocella sp.]
MHQLILLRHAKAAPEIAGSSDHDRPLTKAGQRAAAAIGQAMRKAGLAPDVVLVSSALRTQQTFQALENAALWEEWPNTDTLPALYMATSSQIRDLLRELPETVRSALVIGHNPGLHELAVSLAKPENPQPELARLSDSFPTASLAAFLVTSSWRRLGPSTASLQRFLQPADVL